MTGRPPGRRKLFRHSFGARRVEIDVDDEIAFLLAMRTERVRAGCRRRGADDRGERGARARVLTR